MATIERRGDYQWRAKIRRKGFKTRSKTFDSKPEALAWAREIESSIDKGGTTYHLSGSSLTVRESLDRYERDVTPKKKGAKLEKYRIGLWRREPIADKLLIEVKGSDLAQWRDRTLANGFSASKIRNDLNLLSHVFTIAASEWGMEGLINPVKSIRKPALPQGRDRRLQDNEEEILLKACAESRSQWLLPIVIIALETGMRLGEIMGLRWEHIYVKRQVAHLPDTKNNMRRDVPLSTKAIEILNGLPESDDGRVFPISDESLKPAYKRAVKRAGLLDLRFHDLRHEATSRFFEKGLDMMEVATITGHKTLMMLKRYTHLKAEHLALKLG